MDGTIKSNSRTTGRVLISVAILILLVACVNFTNFSMALTPMRVKNINIQKVLGRSVKSLRIGMVFESVLLSLISFVISLVIIGLLRELNLVSFLKADLSLVDNMDIVLITGGISVALGVLAGLYPSFYVTSFPPALVLKGYFGLSPVGRALRTGLLFFQFFVSCLLIICATFIYLQNRYMLHYDLGYDKDNVVVVEMTRYFMRKNKMAYESKLKESPYIDDVAYSWQKLGSQENYMQMGVDYKDGTIPFKVLPVSWNFFDVMGMKKIGDWKLTEGDDKGGIKFIVSNDAKTYYDMREGDVLNFGWDTNAHPIVGCVGEACFTSLKINMGYVLYSVGDYPNKPISYIRLAKGCDVVSAINHIKKTISGLDSVYPARIEFYDSFFDALYRDEVNISSIISFMSLIAIIISLVGVFGLVLFESQFRRKEIGIRKVMGSTVGEVLALLGKKYILLVVFSFVFSIPVGIYCVTLYFERFVSKVPLYWWVFALAFVMIMAVTMFTVVYQSWKTATMNPCESITSE
jgi:putative ABC transport system permease protein